MQNILEKLEEKRIFCIEVYENNVYITEACDTYFSCRLQKEDCVKLSQMFSALAKCFD